MPAVHLQRAADSIIASGATALHMLVQHRPLRNDKIVDACSSDINLLSVNAVHAKGSTEGECREERGANSYGKSYKVLRRTFLTAVIRLKRLYANSVQNML